MITEPMAQLYRDRAARVRRRHADGRHVRSAEAARCSTSCGRSWATTFAAVVATETDDAQGARALLRRQAARASRASSPTWRTTPICAAAAGDGADGPIDLDERRGAGRQRPGPQAAEHGAADGDSRPRQRHALRAVRGRIQDPHQGRRRALRNGAAAAPPGVRHHDAASRSWRTSTSPSAACRRTAASS